MGHNIKMDHLGHLMKIGHRAAVRCGCGHRVVICLFQLERLFLVRCWNHDLGCVRFKLRCRVCGARHPSIKITMEPVDTSIGPTTESGWHSLVRRLRG